MIPRPELMKTFETGKEVTGEIIRVLDKRHYPGT